MWAERAASKAVRFGIVAGTRKPGIVHKGKNLFSSFPTKRREKSDQLVKGEDWKECDKALDFRIEAQP